MGQGVARYTFPSLWVPHLVMLLVHSCACAPDVSYRIFSVRFGLVFISSWVRSPSSCTVLASISSIITSSLSLITLSSCLGHAKSVIYLGVFLPCSCSDSCAGVCSGSPFFASVAVTGSKGTGRCVLVLMPVLRHVVLP